MSGTASKFKQEMPPSGGYADINWMRVKPQRMFRNWTLLAVTTACFIYGHYHYHHRMLYMGKLEVERYDHLIALEPLLFAERDREYLKQLRRNREEERKLMANVPGWVVGTLWGTPVFRTLKEGDLPTVCDMEYYGHRDGSDNLEYWWPDRWT